MESVEPDNVSTHANTNVGTHVNAQLNDPPVKKRRGFALILGLMLPLGVMLPMWFFFIGPQMRHDRLLEEGVQASGRLLNVDETGTVVNDSPELELTVEFMRADGVLDTAVTDFVPSRRSLHLFQTGVAITAAYDPEDPSELTIVNLSTSPFQSAPVTSTAPDLTTTRVDSLEQVADSLQREIERIKRAD